MSQLFAELENVQWDIIFISESRTPSGTYCLDGGHILYIVLADDDFLGTGILLNAKHAKSTNVVHNISSRVLGLDFRVNGIRIRAVSVYVPYLRYDVEVFDATYDHLRYFCAAGRKQKRRLLIGGDFNSQTGIGERGECLDVFVRSFGLTVANSSDAPWDDQWTFRSCLGDTRKIDFILVSISFQDICGRAVNELHFGSDHRAVQATFWIHAFRHYVNTKKKTRMKWCPIRENKVPHAYLDVLDKIDEGSNYLLHELEVIVVEASHTIGVQVPSEVVRKPWQSVLIQRLIRERRNAPTVENRWRVSKNIQKEMRRELRKYQSIEAEKGAWRI